MKYQLRIKKTKREDMLIYIIVLKLYITINRSTNQLQKRSFDDTETQDTAVVVI
jgi:hypothetical protein